MIAKDLISNDVLPLVSTDNVTQALSMMSVYHIKHLPVVKDNILLGILSEEDATTVDPETEIRDIKISSSYIYVAAEDHIFEVLSRMAENKMTIVPVVDHQERFLGIVSQEDLIKFFSNTFSFKEPGSIIVIETTRKGYSLSAIARVIEMENAAIIASFITSLHESEATLLTIKVNSQDINDILAALERYDYKIKASFTEEEYMDDLKDRYDQLMKYLDV